MTGHTGGVLIAGAGPAGLLLACELRLAGVAVTVVERDTQRPGYCRSFTLNARSLDLLARRGLADQLIAEGWQAPHAPFTGLPVPVGLAGAHTDHPYTLGIPQTRVEEVLEAHAVALGADLRRGHELLTLAQDPGGVDVTVGTAGTAYRLRVSYVAGCDGGRSTVRKQAGIGFPGTPSTRYSLLGDVELADPHALALGVTAGPGGSVFVIPRPGYVRIVTEDPQPDAPVTLPRLQAVLDGVLGRHVALGTPRWLTRFGDAARQADTYVRGRVVLAGDAAHIHPPAGAIGINVALDDALNLGWKLAATVHGSAPAHLLDSYHTERHAAGARVLATTQAQMLLAGPAAHDHRQAALVDLLARVAAHPAGNRALADVVTGLDTRYDMTQRTGHPWLGRLAPDLTLQTAGGTTGVAALLSTGRGVLIDLTGRHAAARTPGVEYVTATCPGHPELAAILLRPDGHTAWLHTTTGEPTDEPDDEPDDGLAVALRHWFGRTGSS